MTAKVMVFAPSPKTEKTVRDVWQKLEEIGSGECEYELEVVVPAGNENTIPVDADALVARGNSATFLRERFHELPVVEIPITGIDVLRALGTCRRRWPGKPVAFIGTPNMMIDMDKYRKITGMDVVAFPIEMRSELDGIMDDIERRGIDIVIAGHYTCVQLERRRFTAVPLHSGAEAIEQALRLGRQSAYYSVMRQQQTMRWRGLIDCIGEGIIAADSRGRISLFNRYASELLGISGEDAIGRQAGDVIKQPRLRELLSGGDADGEIMSISGQELTVSKVSVRFRGEAAGYIAHIQKVSKIQQLEENIRKRSHERGLTAKYTFDSITGESEAMRETIETAKIYSHVDSNVLIEGATGTGKELFAQSIHNASGRRAAPFVAVNCAAIPESLLESELFGYADGAFTGARRGGKAGLFELAHNGTIFLDEIHGMSLTLQGRLLRVIQEKEIMRIGGDKVVPVNVRIISATNRSLRKLVESGEFRDDLYFRLDVLKLELPPLSARGEDAVLMARKFIEGFCRDLGREPLELSPAVCRRLLEHSWPGNVRELRNFCEKLCVLCRGDQVGLDALTSFPMLMCGNDTGRRRSLRGSSREAERREIEAALSRCGGNRSRAAAELGIGRTTLWKKMRELGIE